MKVVERVSRLDEGKWFRTVAIATASLFITSVASIGQVRHSLDQERDAGTVVGTTSDTTASTVESATSSSVVSADPNAPTTTVALAGAPAPRGGRTSTGAGTPASPGGGGTTPTTGQPVSQVAAADIPDFGLRTQGVTDREVKVGYSYNVAACGDAGTLQAMLGSAATGDPKKSIDAFVRHINDTGGIAGRNFKVVVVDDGGDGCPEKNRAAAVKMADEEKVFLAIPGLHVVSDYLVEQRVPVFGGRDDPDSLARIGANGIMLTEAIEPTLEKWSAFGRYYLDSAAHKPCLIHPESGASGDWNSHEKTMLAKFRKYGMSFVDVITYQEDVSTAQQQANTIAARAKSKGCDHVYFMAGNPIALIFFTQAATQNAWFPTWTFTSYMVLSDDDTIMRLMDQRQWENAIGLSTRVPIGEHPKEGNCKKIYEKYYPDDGQSDGAYVKVACAQLLSVAETMRRAVARTGVLTGNSWLLGADAVRNDFFYDATVPLLWSFPSPAGPFKTKAFSHFTVVNWNSTAGRYDFPEYPNYWEVMGPGKSGAQDLRPTFKSS